MQFYWLIVGVLAVWRITNFLHAEDGPGDISVRVRRLAGVGFWGRILDCFLCLSVWIAAPFALWIGEGIKEMLLLWPALSGGAILLERVTRRVDPAPRAFYVEQGGEEDELLREEERELAR